MSGSRRSWGRPDEGPWWRFVPRSRAAGVLGILAGGLILFQAGITLAGSPSSGLMALEIFCAVLGCMLLARNIDGLRILRRREGR